MAPLQCGKTIVAVNECRRMQLFQQGVMFVTYFPRRSERSRKILAFRPGGGPATIYTTSPRP
jgi:hypothetical protein